MKRRIFDYICYFVLGIFAIVALFPAFFVFINSFFSSAELSDSYGNIIGYNSDVDFKMHFIPINATLTNYIRILITSSSYLMKFWISLAISFAIMAGQVIISCISGYGFAKFNFKGKKVFFFLIIILMMMPIQVIIVSNYIILDKFNLIGSYASIILPGIFSTFGVFLMTQVFSAIPSDIIEAAKVDGASHLRILFNIVVPCSKSGILSLVILNFIDSWNMVEQPLVFLKDSYKFPLSVFLSRINESDLGLGFACSVLAILPAFFLFLFLSENLIQGIEYSNLK